MLPHDGFAEPVSHVRLRIAQVAVLLEEDANDHLAPPPPADAPAAGGKRRLSDEEELKAMLPVVETEVARFLRRLPRSVLKDDLMSAGMLGLLDALRRNKGPRDARFEHYIRIRVRGAILDELRREDWLSRADRAKQRAATSTMNVVHMEDLSEAHGDAESPEESPVDATARHMCWKAVTSAMDALPAREREIIDLYYLRGWMVKDIARAMGVSEPRISQLHAQAVGRLREWLSNWDERALEHMHLARVAG